jgi:hypothetical protein
MDLAKQLKTLLDIIDKFLADLENIDEAFKVADSIDVFIERSMKILPQLREQGSKINKESQKCLETKIALLEKTTNQVRTEMIGAGYMMMPDTAGMGEFCLGHE